MGCSSGFYGRFRHSKLPDFSINKDAVEFEWIEPGMETVSWRNHNDDVSKGYYMSDGTCCLKTEALSICWWLVSNRTDKKFCILQPASDSILF